MDIELVKKSIIYGLIVTSVVMAYFLAIVLIIAVGAGIIYVFSGITCAIILTMYIFFLGFIACSIGYYKDSQK